MKKANDVYLFVYGTLKRNFNNFYSTYLRNNAVFIAEGWIFGELYDISGYPGLVLAAKNKVYGEIYGINKEVLYKLDDYEETGKEYTKPNEYTRKLLKVFSRNNEYECWTYIYNRDVKGYKKIDSGNY